MIVLGIDPGTAALGYGIVERSAGRLREVDHGCLVTSPDLSMPERLLRIHALVDELIGLHQPDLVAVERLFFSRNAQTAFAVGQARGVVLLAAAQHGTAVREATPSEVKVAVTGYGAADKAQVARMVQLVLGMSDLPRPDDAADALAIATWAANAERDGRRSPGAAVLDRAAVAPISRGESSYDRAVREALAAERGATRAAKRTRLLGRRSARDRLGRGHGRRGRASIRSSSRSAGSATRCSRRPRSSPSAVPGGRLKLHTYHLVREDQQALYGFRSADELGFFTLLLTVNGVGPKVALAIVGSRPTADLQLAIMTQDQAVLVSIPGIGKKLAERIIFELKEKVTAAGVAAAGPSVRGRRRERGRDRRRAPGARLLAGRGPRGVARSALADVGVGEHARGAGQGRAAEPRRGTEAPPERGHGDAVGRVPISQESPAHSGVSSRATSRPERIGREQHPIGAPAVERARGSPRPRPRSALRSGVSGPCRRRRS